MLPSLTCLAVPAHSPEQSTLWISRVGEVSSAGGGHEQTKRAVEPMENITTVDVILKSKGQAIWSVTPQTLVYDALKLMADKNIGALLVMEQERLVGIVSERDYARKVALLGRTSKTLPVRDILTEAVHTVTRHSTIRECMQKMTDKRVRHLPVLEGEKVVGIISIGDVMNWLTSAQRAAIDQLQAYIAGGYPV